jgi:hypothetical protein
MKANDQTSKPTKEQMKKVLEKIIQYQRSKNMNTQEEKISEASLNQLKNLQPIDGVDIEKKEKDIQNKL